MVRLWAAFITCPFVCTGFQFHYGSIMGRKYLLIHTESIPFQFHYGSIMGDLGHQFLITQKLFQFHYGSIMGNDGQEEIKNRSISIPLWFDYGNKGFTGFLDP